LTLEEKWYKMEKQTHKWYKITQIEI